MARHREGRIESEPARRSYMPELGVPLTLLIGVLTAVTAVAGSYLARGAIQPTWMTAVGCALVMTAVYSLPALNARAGQHSRGQRVFAGVVLGAAIGIPLALVYPAAAVGGLGWLMLVAVGAQLTLGIVAALVGRREQSE